MYMYIYIYIYIHIYIYIFRNLIKPTRCIQILQILHEQIGFQCFISVLNAAEVVTCFISWGMEFQILGPRYDVDYLPYVSVLT